MDRHLSLQGAAFFCWFSARFYFLNFDKRDRYYWLPSSYGGGLCALSRLARRRHTEANAVQPRGVVCARYASRQMSQRSFGPAVHRRAATSVQAAGSQQCPGITSQSLGDSDLY